MEREEACSFANGREADEFQWNAIEPRIVRRSTLQVVYRSALIGDACPLSFLSTPAPALPPFPHSRDVGRSTRRKIGSAERSVMHVNGWRFHTRLLTG